MSSSPEARRYWHDILVAGGRTSIPRWTHRPSIGIADHTATLDRRLVATLRALAHELSVPLSTLLLAAHAKVLVALSGDLAVTTGYVAANGRPLPCRLSPPPGSWHRVLTHVRSAEICLLEHQHCAVDDLRCELGLTAPPFEVVLDPTGSDVNLVEHVVLRVGFVDDGTESLLRVRYRTEAMDSEAAKRITGYHLTALALMASDPQADHTQQSLLSAEELRFQIGDLAGRRRKLPGCRVHQLFERQVKACPDAIAAVEGGRRWTYRDLNARANQIGRSLLARGLRREAVVAVVTERNLDWMAAVLAVFKAGGAYLPVEPHFPAERIAAMLTRAGCRLVLTERGGAGNLGPVLETMPDVAALTVDAAYAEGHDVSNLGVAVTPDQLAYIYFTSGSTGEPKGAMCEHAGFLNHLMAKVDDLQIGAGHVVAQTAPQCFDISLWQLLSAVIVGGQTLLVDQDVILDVDRFVDTIENARVSVFQVVPSYLAVVLTSLERHPRTLPDLRFVSVTGEALKKELTQRWFSAAPGIGLVNAYGLTETSDDTNHEVMDRPPDREIVPLGRPVNNVHVYVVDQQLSPVPLGAPGVVVFSGVCVGRGYVNDPELTRQAYLDDPHRPGHRLYRGGDYGRWLPDGKLEFLGRQDAQVKIRGFRIEIGEVENTLLRVPGIRDGAVVVAERAGQNKCLAAFYSGERGLDVEMLRDRMGASLPEYMVPTSFYWYEPLPLTANGKIDRNELTRLAGTLEVTEADGDVPRTPGEQRLAVAWAKVLAIPGRRIGRHDNFFESGGTSLSAVELALALDRDVSLKEIRRHPVLADLARILDTPAVPAQSATHLVSAGRKES